MLIVLLLVNIISVSQGLQRPLVIGHRGTAYLPELTLASQALAHAYGADVIEIDVCLSGDNQLIVIHGKLAFQFNFYSSLSHLSVDIYLNGVTNVEEVFANRSHSNNLHYVIDFTLEELRRLTVHERVIPLNGTQVYPLRFPSKTNVPFQLATLNETIELIRGLNRATNRTRELLIEIKKPEYHWQHNRSISSIVFETLKAYNLTQKTDPIILQTFHIEELFYIRNQLGCQLRLNALMTLNEVNESSSDYDFYRSEAGIRNLSKTVQALAPYYVLVVNLDANGKILGPTDLTKLAHQYGLKVYPFTFRQDLYPGTSFEEFVRYFWQTVEVDGLISDHPDVILEIFETKSGTATIYLQSLFLLLILPCNLIFNEK